MAIYQKLNQCIFCNIIKKINLAYYVLENQHAIAILDAFPINTGHILIISKNCVPNLQALQDQELLAIQKLTQKAIKLLEKRLNAKGFNILNNYNEIAGQIINHYHLHIIPKYHSNDGLKINHSQSNPNLKNEIKNVWKKLLGENDENNNSRKKF